jgi:hypothetical protein
MKRLYWLTASLLIVHEIDSAFWREWELFRLPGGVEGFLALHVALTLLVLWGYERVIARDRSGVWMALAVGAAGVATAAIHGAFLARGGAEFRTPASIAVIAATAVAGLALLSKAASAAASADPTVAS